MHAGNLLAFHDFFIIFFSIFFTDSEVKCLWCETVLNEWEYGDQVMARHRSANPDCPFIRNISDNVPLLASSSNNESQQLHSGLNSTSQASQSQGMYQSETLKVS